MVTVSRQNWSEGFPSSLSTSASEKKKRSYYTKTQCGRAGENQIIFHRRKFSWKMLKLPCKEVLLPHLPGFLCNQPDALLKNQKSGTKAPRAPSQSALLEFRPLSWATRRCSVPCSLPFPDENLFYQKDFQSHVLQLSAAKLEVWGLFYGSIQVH